MDTKSTNISERGSSDRRELPTPVISKYSFIGGKRKHIRRAGNRKEHLFVDLYSTRLLIAVLVLLCLSCLDAYLTLVLISKGKVVEANPVMAYFLNMGVMPFTTIKFSITALSAVIMCLLKNVSITRISLPFAIKIYLLIIAYEFYLFTI